MSSSTDGRVGTTCGRFHIDAVLGEGGMSTVYAATRDDGQRLALKILKSEHAGDANLRDRFLREARIANAIDHPACVTIQATGVTPQGEPLLVMELIDGEPLDRVWRRLGRKLPLVSALRVAEQVLSFLHVCHRHDVIHRDIKPTNLILTRDRSVKVLDFGIAHAPTLGIVPPASDVMTGTPSFMSPEQAIGDPDEIDARADLFAVGALIFTLLAGQLLHRGNDHRESLFLAATQRAPSLGDVCPDLPDDVIELVDCALSPSRDDRFSDARSMRAVILEVLEREAARLSVQPHYGSLAPAAAHDDESGERIRASTTSDDRRPDAKGSLGQTPLPQLLVHICARALTGVLVLFTPQGRRDVWFAEGAPALVQGEEGPTSVALERLGTLPASTDFEFFTDEALLSDMEQEGIRPSDPLASIMAVTRRWSGGALLRATLAKLGERPLLLHRSASLDRFALDDVERRVVSSADGLSMTYGELLDAAVAPRPVVDAVIFALGVTRHLDLNVPGAWPLAVARDKR